MQQISVQQSTMYRDGLYWYVITGSSLSQSIDDIEAIVAILESRTSMYVGYWFKSTNNIGYTLNINNELTFAINSSTTLIPINFFGNRVLNASLIFYNSATKSFKSYEYKYFKLIYRTELKEIQFLRWKIRYKYIYFNKTYIRYVADYNSRTSYDSYTLYPFRLLRIDIPAEQKYRCFDEIFYNCKLIPEPEPGPGGAPIIHYSVTDYLIEKTQGLEARIEKLEKKDEEKEVPMR